MWQILLSSLRLSRDVLRYPGPEEQHRKIDNLVALQKLIQDVDDTAGAAGFRLHFKLLMIQGRLLQAVVPKVVKWYREAITPALVRGRLLNERRARIERRRVA